MNNPRSLMSSRQLQCAFSRVPLSFAHTTSQTDRNFMNCSLFLRGWIVSLVLLSASVCGWAQESQPRAAAGKCLAYTKPDGESFFALTMNLKVERADESPRQVVILFDTSASQTGFARDKSLEVLDALLVQLRPTDKINLMALDVDAVPMTDGWVDGNSVQLEQGVKKLKLRAPLGATDLPLGLTAAQESFSEENSAPRTVVYIGDGLSPAHLLVPKSLQKLVDSLVEAKVAVSSYLIGSRIDTPLAASIANHTGGVVSVENNAVSAKKYGLFLANAVRAQVLWPRGIKAPPEIVEFFPNNPPPLRTDRDSVLIGRGVFTEPFDLTILIGEPGPKRALTWTFEPTKSDDNNAYLAELVASARKHGGVMLPLAGSGGLIEARLVLNQDLRNLVVLCRQALAMNSPDQAELLARKALDIDATSIDAQNMLQATMRQYYNVAQQAFEQKEFNQAAQLCFKALAIDPAFKEAQELLQKLPKVGNVPKAEQEEE